MRSRAFCFMTQVNQCPLWVSLSSSIGIFFVTHRGWTSHVLWRTCLLFTRVKDNCVPFCWCPSELFVIFILTTPLPCPFCILTLQKKTKQSFGLKFLGQLGQDNARTLHHTTQTSTCMGLRPHTIEIQRILAQIPRSSRRHIYNCVKAKPDRNLRASRNKNSHCCVWWPAGNWNATISCNFPHPPTELSKHLFLVTS